MDLWDERKALLKGPNLWLTKRLLGSLSSALAAVVQGAAVGGLGMKPRHERLKKEMRLAELDRTLDALRDNWNRLKGAGLDDIVTKWATTATQERIFFTGTVTLGPLVTRLDVSG